jgi:hypothetical protein
VAATRKGEGALAALMQAALSLPILVVPAKAAAAEVGEVGIATLAYKERGLIKVTEPILWGRVSFAEVWEVQASGAVDIVSGASPELVSNVSGRPVQTVTAASVDDRRTTGDVKVTRRLGDASFSISRALSNEEDYRSRAFGLEARLDLDARATTLVAGYGKSNDRVGSSIDPLLHERRDTREYLAGVTRVISPVALVQSVVTATRGRGWYNDPYKSTLTFYPGENLPAFVPDTRPDHRDTLAWLTRYRRHFPGLDGTLQADYRYYRDDWGIRAHTLELAWQQSFAERWALRPAVRYYTQAGADFYSPVVPRPQPALQSSDQRLSAFGSLSPSLRAILRLDKGLAIEATVGYIHSSASLQAGGSGNAAFETLRAYYGLVSVTWPF